MNKFRERAYKAQRRAALEAARINDAQTLMDREIEGRFAFGEFGANEISVIQASEFSERFGEGDYLCFDSRDTLYRGSTGIAETINLICLKTMAGLYGDDRLDVSKTETLEGAMDLIIKAAGADDGGVILISENHGYNDRSCITSSKLFEADDGPSIGIAIYRAFEKVLFWSIGTYDGKFEVYEVSDEIMNLRSDEITVISKDVGIRIFTAKDGVEEPRCASVYPHVWADGVMGDPVLMRAEARFHAEISRGQAGMTGRF